MLMGSQLMMNNVISNSNNIPISTNCYSPIILPKYIFIDGIRQAFFFERIIKISCQQLVDFNIINQTTKIVTRKMKIKLCVEYWILVVISNPSH